MGVEIRTREELVYDGTTGAQVDAVTYYELGDELEGVFVPFVTKNGAYIDHLVSLGKAAQEAEKETPTKKSATSSSTTES